MNGKEVPLSSLSGFDTVSKIIGTRPAHHFNKVISFHFKEKEDLLGDHWHDIELILSDDQSPFNAIGYCFHRVADIRYSGFSQILGLYIQNIVDKGWEKLLYEIDDYEDGHIHLYCQAVTLFQPLNSKV